jgi:hypothetical protein
MNGTIHIQAFIRMLVFDRTRGERVYQNLALDPEEPDVNDFVRTYCEISNYDTPEWYSIARTNKAGEWETTPRIYLRH